MTSESNSARRLDCVSKGGMPRFISDGSHKKFTVEKTLKDATSKTDIATVMNPRGINIFSDQNTLVITTTCFCLHAFACG